MRLKDKVAIVTGAGSGFGEGMARRFAGEGAKLLVVDINDQEGRRVADTIAQAGGAARYVHADVSIAREVAGMVAEAVIVVNNAGVPQRNGPMLGVDEATFDRIFAVNVKSLYLAALHAVPALERRGGGVIINTASTAGLRPRPGLVWYNGSKGAVISLTKAMAIELAPKKIRVNALCPVAGDTPMLGDFMGGDTPENRARFIAFLTGVALEVDGGRCI